MTIVDFTPATGAAGGLLIGLAAAGLLLIGGRIAGISGILGGAIAPRMTGDRAWRCAFLAGLIVGGVLGQHVVPQGLVIEGLPGTGTVLAAGLLVGIGTRMANGCTSGHGVCGLALFSPRSIVATLSFMLAGALTVFVVRHGV